jgi:hypothetical protein
VCPPIAAQCIAVRRLLSGCEQIEKKKSEHIKVLLAQSRYTTLVPKY